MSRKVRAEEAAEQLKTKRRKIMEDLPQDPHGLDLERLIESRADALYNAEKDYQQYIKDINNEPDDSVYYLRDDLTELYDIYYVTDSGSNIDIVSPKGPISEANRAVSVRDIDSLCKELNVNVVKKPTEPGHEYKQLMEMTKTINTYRKTRERYSSYTCVKERNPVVDSVVGILVITLPDIRMKMFGLFGGRMSFDDVMKASREMKWCKDDWIHFIKVWNVLMEHLYYGGKFEQDMFMISLQRVLEVLETI